MFCTVNGKLVNGSITKPNDQGKPGSTQKDIKCPTGRICADGACVLQGAQSTTTPSTPSAPVTPSSTPSGGWGSSSQQQEQTTFERIVECRPLEIQDGSEKGVKLTLFTAARRGTTTVVEPRQARPPIKIFNGCVPQSAIPAETAKVCRQPSWTQSSIGQDITASFDDTIAAAERALVGTNTNMCQGGAPCAPTYGCISQP